VCSQVVTGPAGPGGVGPAEGRFRGIVINCFGRGHHAVVVDEDPEGESRDADCHFAGRRTVGLKPKTWSRRTRHAVGAGVVVAAALAIAAATTPAFAGVNAKAKPVVKTATPIKHVVVIFQENVSFDHYFGTYPKAANTDGTTFKAAPGTPVVNGLTKKLLTDNPNEYNPSRLDPSQALTCDQNHSYGPEQKAYDGGKADAFVQNTETDKCTGQPIIFGQPGLVMDYYDGNTVTGLWNYAQNYAMSDNSFDTTFGPSTPGALNLISGQTHGVVAVDPTTGKQVSNALVGSPDKKGCRHHLR
jgi:phospholipase C